MGVLNLTKFLRDRAPGAVRKLSLAAFCSKPAARVAVDTSIFAYRFKHNQGRFLEGLFGLTVHFLQHNLQPIFVFDGKPPEEKRATLQRRREARRRAQERELHTGKPALVVTREDFDLAHDMFRHMRIPTVLYDGEADQCCCELLRRGWVVACVSEDMDLLPFGGRLLLRNVRLSTPEVTAYDIGDILRELDLTFPQFVDFCILCGTDFASTIYSIGPVKAYRLIRSHGTIEGVVAALRDTPGRHTSSLDTFEFQRARNVFASRRTDEEMAPFLEPLSDDTPEPVDAAGLREFLHVRTRMRPATVERNVQALVDLSLKWSAPPRPE